MGRRSRRKVDAVIGVALVLGLIGSEMRPDGAIVGSKMPTALERTDAEIQAAETVSAGIVDQALVEELGRIKGLDENIAGHPEKGGVILPVLPMPMPKSAIRPDHCYSSFSGKEVKQEPGLIWQLPAGTPAECFQAPLTYPVTDIQYMPSAFELLHQRIGIGDHQHELQAELADLVAAVRPASGEQSPLSFSSGAGANPEELLNEILAENGQLGFDEPPPFSPSKVGLLDDPFFDPSQDIFRWMEQGALFDPALDGASTSQPSDLFGLNQHLPQYSEYPVQKDLPAANTDRTIDELLYALESEEKSIPFASGATSEPSVGKFDPMYTDCDPPVTLIPEPAIGLSFNASRKRRSEPSWSSGASSSSKSCAFEPIHRDYHNHTYGHDDGAAERRAQKVARARSGTSSDESSAAGALRCKDLQDFERLRIPFSYDNVISAEPSAFNSMVGDHRLNDEQKQLMRASRRRAKNRNAARQCRQRRVDEVEELADEVEGLEEERNRLVSEMDEIDADIAAQRAANERLQAFIIEAYTQQRPPTLRDAEYRLQSNPRNGSFSLVEQRGIRA